MIIIASKRRKIEKLQAEYPGAIIADVTSQAKDGLVRLSPFFRKLTNSTQIFTL